MIEVEIGDSDVIEPFYNEPGCGQVVIYGDYYQVDDEGVISTEKIKVH